MSSLGKAVGLGGGGAGIRIEGWREFQRKVNRATGTNLPRAMNQAHMEIGRVVTSRLRPPTVGAGRGASVELEATPTDLFLKAGFSGRENRAKQWGKIQEWPGGQAPARPYIIGTARQQQQQIMDALFDGIESALKPPFD